MSQYNRFDESFLLDGKTRVQVLGEFETELQKNTFFHLGYPYNLDHASGDLGRFLNYSINNLGDPYIGSNYNVQARYFERLVVEFFAKVWKIDSYWGYVTNSGTEGNLQGILVGRENLPDGVLYSSRDSHYSIFKAAKFFRMDAVAIDTDLTGEMDYEHLERAIVQNLDRPVIVNANIGTTVKGAVDNVHRIISILQRLRVPRERYYIHCDGALFGMMLPFIDAGDKAINFESDIDSLAMSGHKFLGSPMPCGVMLVRKKLMDPMQKPVEYLNSVDSTITGSRNGHAPLFMWNELVRKGQSGLQQDAYKCIKNARYLFSQLQQNGFSCMLNDLSNTVIFERPSDENAIRKWQLACEGSIAHVVVMPNVGKEKIDLFVQDMHTWKHAGTVGNLCVASKVGTGSCACPPCNSSSSLSSSASNDSIELVSSF